jgi:phosphoserine phosphatase
MSRLILQGIKLNAQSIHTISEQVEGKLIERDSYAMIDTDKTDLQLDSIRSQYEFDINLIPDGFDVEQVRLLVTDMDSTLISIECIDEIADFINVKPQVSEITEAAMRGEIDFETSLRKRVSLLKGLDVTALEAVYEQRLQLNPGAEVMLKSLKNHGIKTALVSGGFTFFTERLKQRLNLDFTMANVLGEHNGKLTGEVVGDICGAKAKADFLLAHCELLGINAGQVIAMGDGANDLLMMDEAGLSVAYHAKPKVQQQAKTALNYCGLDGVLGLLQHNYN